MRKEYTLVNKESISQNFAVRRLQGQRVSDERKENKITLLFLYGVCQCCMLGKIYFLRDIFVAVFRLRKGDVPLFIPPPTLYK
jgi:hypothetical protein